MIVYKSKNSSWCGLLPDFPGCWPVGENLNDLLEDVQDAVEVWMEGEDPAIFPVPTSIDVIQACEDAKGRIVTHVNVDISFLDNAVQRIKITAPRYARHMINEPAKA
jgi:predicted RNase H-like HicB family nuclease